MNGFASPLSGEHPEPRAGKTDRPDQRLDRSRRLIRSSCFQEAFAQQHKRVGRYMVLWRRSGDDAALRLGVVTSRKVGGAVKRVKARRMLREVFRRNRWQLAGAYDLVLVARAALVAATFHDIEQEFLTLARKSGLLKDS